MNDRPTSRLVIRALTLLAATAVLATGLVLALPDNPPTAEAHEPEAGKRCPAGYVLDNSKSSCTKTTTTTTPATATCAAGNLAGGKCVTTATSKTVASYRCTSGTLASGAFGVPVCRHTASPVCPGGYNYLWGSCYHPTTFQLTSPVCPRGYAKSGGSCFAYTLVSWYCAAGRGSLQGTFCVLTTIAKTNPAYKCSQGGTKVGSQCHTTTIQTRPFQPTCSDTNHVLNSGRNKCVHWSPPPTTTPSPTAAPTPTSTPAPTANPTPTTQPTYVTCPNGYQYGIGSLGDRPPYAAPSGKYWTRADAIAPLFPARTCWQLRTGGCPAGQTMAAADIVLGGYKNPPKAPNGKQWTLASTNVDYACYKLAEKSTNLINIIVDGVTYAVVRGGKVVIDHAEYIVHAPNPKLMGVTLLLKVVTGRELSPAEGAVKEAFETAITALDKAAQTVLCNSIVEGLTVGIPVAQGGAAYYVSKTDEVSRVIRAAAAGGAKGSLIGAVAGASIYGYCRIKEHISQDNSDEEETPSATPTATPTAQTTPTATATPEPKRMVYKRVDKPIPGAQCVGPSRSGTDTWYTCRVWE